MTSQGESVDATVLEPPFTRRGFVSALAALSSGAALPRHAAATSTQVFAEADTLGSPTWEEVRAMFDLRPDRIHMAGLLFASHPRPVRNAITAATRVIAITWVHSGTGVKVPVRAIAEIVATANRSRATDRRIYLAVDGVHALGVEDFELPGLGCDFFAAGTHKWLFGPRGTGFLWGRADAWAITRPTIPTWQPGVFYSLIGWRERPAIGGGQLMSPGGYHAFDHTWAVGSAFDLQASLGKTRVAERIHQLNRELKEAIRAMPHVRLATPMSADLGRNRVPGCRGHDSGQGRGRPQ